MHKIEKLNVLIVEDEPLISIFIKKIVQEMGENIAGICYSGEEALEQIKLKKPNLIFMDIYLQGSLDGISVIKKAEIAHKPTVFFVSAYSDKETINEALSVNPYSFLVKPIKEEDIEIAVILARKDQLKIALYNQSNFNILSSKDHIIVFGEFTYDNNSNTLLKDGDIVLLSKNETSCINALIKNRNSYITAEQLISHIWSDDTNRISSLRELIFRLRKKIVDLPLSNMPNMGYCLTIK